MESLLQIDPATRFANFNVLTTTYKTVHDHEITTDVLYPKSLSSEQSKDPRPVLLRYHGGGLIGGSSLFAAFFTPWYLELAEEYGAIIVSPNYRMLPESSMAEIMGDIEDHWKWVHQTLPAVLEEKTGGSVRADLTRILTGGDSAGGYLSFQVALSHPEEIRAVTAEYPMTVVKSDHQAGGYEKVVLGLPSLPKDTVANRVAAVKAQEAETGRKVIVTEDYSEERLKLMFAMCQQGQFGPFLPENVTEFYPLDRLRAGAKFPRGGVFVLHGRQDSVVPVGESYLLKEILDEVDSELPLRLVVRDGEHGFSHAAKLHDEWLWEGLQGVIRAWLE